MKTAVICNTPFQVFNMLNLFYHDDSFGKIDLFLINRFSSSSRLYEKLKNIHFFENVHYVSPVEKIEESKWSIFLKMLFPELYKNHYRIDNWEIIKNDYNFLFYGDLEPLGRIIEYLNPKVESFVYDDGGASYFGNALFDCKSKKIQFIEKSMRVGVARSKIQGLYVNAKAISKSTISKNILQLPILDDEKFISLTKDIFEYKTNDAIASHKYLIMDYPMERITEYNGFDLVDFMHKNEGDKCLLRYHPCSTRKNSNLVDIDLINNLWELDCLYSVTEKHVLISYFSSSQLLPKLLVDKEPYVIFTYKLMLNHNGMYRCKGNEEFINLVKSRYKNKSKIFIPNNEQELIEALSIIDSQI